jgi:hypothetical protein
MCHVVLQQHLPIIFLRYNFIYCNHIRHIATLFGCCIKVNHYKYVTVHMKKCYKVYVTLLYATLFHNIKVLLEINNVLQWTIIVTLPSVLIVK